MKRWVSGAVAASAAALVVLGANSARSEERLAPPLSEAVLMVSGKIARTTDGVAALFDVAMLEALGTVTFRANLPEDDAPTVYAGVPATVVLDYLAADGQSLTLRTFDNEAAIVSIAELARRGAMLAVRRDGDFLDPKGAGPIMLIYAEAGGDAAAPGGSDDRRLMRLASLRVD